MALLTFLLSQVVKKSAAKAISRFEYRPDFEQCSLSGKNQAGLSNTSETSGSDHQLMKQSCVGGSNEFTAEFAYVDL